MIASEPTGIVEIPRAGWVQPLLAAYGIDPDPHRTAYYRLLWDLGP